MTDHSSAERRRIRAVYDSYERDGSTGRWDASQPGNDAIITERSRRVAALLADPPRPDRTLEVGCGRGDVLASLPVGPGARIGVDLLGDRLRDASAAPGALLLVEADGAALPVADRSVDLAVAFTVFSSVLDDRARTALADELARVLRPGGHLLWYDIRRANPANPRVRPVRTSDLRRLFPGWAIAVTPITLLPPLARRLGRRTDRWYPRLGRLRPLRSHLVGLLTRPADGG